MRLRSDHQTGVYDGMADPEYRQDGALSTSLLKEMGKSPKHFHAKWTGLIPNVDTECFRFGRLFHMYVLEPNRFEKEVVVCPDEHADRRQKANKEWWAKAKANGAEIIKEKELEKVVAMSDAFNALPEISSMKGARNELSVFANGFRRGIDAKCRIDMEKDGVVVDIKTTRDGGASEWEFMRTSRQFKYAWQEANYRDIAAKAGLEIKTWYWAVIEKEPPYEAGIYTFTADDIARARRELSEAYTTLQSCLTLDSWPSYTPTTPRELRLYGGL